MDDERRPQAIMDVYIGVFPFFLAICLAVVTLLVFPQIALWLPATMKGS